MKDLVLEEELAALWRQLVVLRSRLDEYTRARYNRINPFIENLFDWKEKGSRFGKNVTIYDSTTIHGDIKIGDNTWIGPFCTLDGSGGLTIGAFCVISSGVRILSHDTVMWALSGGKAPYEYAPVSIGDCCFVGVEAVILRGVSIGKHCVIGANAVVTANVPDCSVVAGVPARRIGEVKITEDSVEIIIWSRKGQKRDG